jgi:hypothetical protein
LWRRGRTLLPKGKGSGGDHPGLQVRWGFIKKDSVLGILNKRLSQKNWRFLNRFLGLER